MRNSQRSYLETQTRGMKARIYRYAILQKLVDFEAGATYATCHLHGRLKEYS